MRRRGFAQDDVRVSFGVAAVGAGLDIALGVSIGVCLRGARDFPKTVGAIDEVCLPPGLVTHVLR